MYRLFRLLLCAAMAALVGASALFAASANAPWGDAAQIQVGVVIHPGVSVPAWPEVNKNDITGDATSFIVAGKSAMEAVGDGTYQFRTDLVPGGVYNYIFGARIMQGAWGFDAEKDYAEPIPDGSQQDDSGNYATSDPGTFVSLSSTAYSSTGDGGVSYVNIVVDNNGNSRRKLDMPTVDPGTTIYVFNNFGSLPRGVANYSVKISSGRVDLNWQGALGTWGSGMPSVDALGGRNLLYVSTSNSAGPYSLLADLAGTATHYAHSGLANGTSYYFIFVSSDPYGGVTLSTYTASKSLWANLSRGIPPTGTMWNSGEYAHNDKYGKPSGPVPVYFKVENIDENYVREHGDLVYLTPWHEDGRLYRHKIQGVFLSAYLPKG